MTLLLPTPAATRNILLAALLVTEPHFTEQYYRQEQTRKSDDTSLFRIYLYIYIYKNPSIHPFIQPSTQESNHISHHLRTHVIEEVSPFSGCSTLLNV